MTKLGLGTVQFGQAYGVSNTRGQIGSVQARAPPARATAEGVFVRIGVSAHVAEAPAMPAERSSRT